MDRQLRVAVIGFETCHAGTPRAYTVYRTAVTYRGFCYQRLIRFRSYLRFSKQLRLAPGADRINVKLPPKIWWSRQASLQPETVEERQVLLNEYMQQVCRRPLTQRSHTQLLKLLQVGEFAPMEEEDRVINCQLITKQHSSSLTDPSSDILERDNSMQMPVIEDEAEALLKTERPQKSCTDEEEAVKKETSMQLYSPQKCPESWRQDSPASSNPAADDNCTDSLELMPMLQVATHDINIPPKRVAFMSTQEQGATRLALKEGAGDFNGSTVDFTSTPERHYFAEIDKHWANIKVLIDGSD